MNADQSNLIPAREYTSIFFKKTSKFNNFFIQVYEQNHGKSKMKKLDIVDAGEFYDENDLFNIIKRSSTILNIKIDDQAALEIARRSRGTPRISNRILKRARDFAQIKSDGLISLTIYQGNSISIGVSKIISQSPSLLFFFRNLKSSSSS